MSEVAALVIQPDGSIEELADTTYDTLKAALRGGWLEGVTIAHDCRCFCDEEGKIKGLQPNGKATALAHHSGLLDIIVGPLIVCGPVDDEGETLPITPEWEAKIRSM